MKKVLTALLTIGLLLPVFCFGDEIELVVDGTMDITNFIKFVIIGIKDPENLFVAAKPDGMVKAFKEGDNIDMHRDIKIHYLDGYIVEYQILDEKNDMIYTDSSDKANANSKDEANTNSKDEANINSKGKPNTNSRDKANTNARGKPNTNSKGKANTNAKDETNTNSKDETNTNSKDETNTNSKTDDVNVVSLSNESIEIPLGNVKQLYTYEGITQIFKECLDIDKLHFKDGYKLICTIYQKNEQGKKVHISSRTFNIVDSGLYYLTLDNISVSPIFMVNIGKNGPSRGSVKAADFALGVNYMFFVKSEKYKHVSNLLFGLNASVSHTGIYNEYTQETDMTTVVNWAGTLGYRFGNLLLQFIVGMGNAAGNDKYLQIGFGIGKGL